ncbi:MAG TPA: hypothetical protein ENJ16_02045, partial [Planctomycetaceae bacterium]|nr:hypothetical protein [Planctomycetaceae bacterium]
LDYRSVINGHRAYGVHRGRLLGYDLTKVRTSLYEKKVGNQTVRPLRWDVEQLWKPVTLQSGSQEPTDVSIQAGSRLYTHVGKTLIAVDLPSGEKERPHVAWKQVLPHVPRAMLAASSRLIVVLANGSILCFGEEREETDLPVLMADEERPAPDQLSRRSDEATRLLEATSEEIGYAVILGLKDGGLVEELLERSRLHVIAVDNNAQLVDDLRQRWMDRGWYGRRVDVLKGDPATIELPPYVATLVATERSGASGPLVTIDPARLARIVRPYGGLVFATGLNTGEIDSLAERWRKISNAGMEVTTSSDSVIWRRPDALPGAADWTHETSDAARSYFSSDERVRAPLGILWYGDSDDYGFHKWKDYGRGVKPQVCRGRLFAFNDRTRVLRAVDIYTGRRFWEYTLPTSLVRFVSLPDGVYVAHGRTCEVLDPKTGKPISRWQVDVDVPQGHQVGVVAVLADGDVVLIGFGFDLPTHSSHPAIQEGLWNARQLVALDRTDGRQLWTQTASRRFNLHAIAMGGGRVYAVDSPSPQELERAVRRGRKPESTEATMHCWDSRSGKLLWRQTMASPPLPSLSWLSIRANDDWVAYNRKHDIVLAGKSGRMRALSAATGRELWPLRPGGQQPLIVADDWVLNQSGIKHDVRTGKPLTQQVILKRQGGGNYAVGTRHLLFWRQICASYIDIETGETQSLRNLRSGCSNSIVAAGGIVSVPCYSIGCVCNYPLQTSFAMYHLPELQEWGP